MGKCQFLAPGAPRIRRQFDIRRVEALLGFRFKLQILVYDSICHSLIFKRYIIIIPSPLPSPALPLLPPFSPGSDNYAMTHFPLNSFTGPTSTTFPSGLFHPFITLMAIDLLLSPAFTVPLKIALRFLPNFYFPSSGIRNYCEPVLGQTHKDFEGFFTSFHLSKCTMSAFSLCSYPNYLSYLNQRAKPRWTCSHTFIFLNKCASITVP